MILLSWENVIEILPRSNLDSFNFMVRHSLFFVLITLGACNDSIETRSSFYYWKTTFRLSKEELNALTENKAKRLYIRFFDVVLKEGKAVPESPIVFGETPKSIEVVPVVYIKNEVMLQSGLDVNELADKVYGLVVKITSSIGLSVAEFQIDCDWSAQSRLNYFQFLELLRKKSNMRLSATIRLHQIKYFERTGIPPVEKGVLMYYNMGRIGPDRANSIYERDIARRYLDRLPDYPLALDVAFPVFAWGVHIRNNNVIGLIRDVTADTFEADNHFKKLEGLYFETKINTIKRGYLFQEGDRIKIESITSEDLVEMSSDLRQKIKQPPSEVIFFDLDKFNLKQFENANHVFQEISSDF
jgi:hypothetical protein